ncbi:hypothetical protein I4U23_020890 [Adineta vaga]|nr:hypothetical protein I4U23_020890 [Adineta vaga]
MDSTHVDDFSTRESGEETSTRRGRQPQLNPPMTSRTMGEINTEVQELRRENFNLKLRIFFLEERSDIHDSNTSLSPDQVHQIRLPSQYGTHPQQQIGHSIGYGDQAVSSIRQLSSTKTSDNQSINDNDELRELKVAFVTCNEENIKLRRMLDDASNRGLTPSSFSHTGSSTPNNIPTVQFDERERQLQNEIDSLKKKLKQINEEHQAELKKYDEHKIRADNTLRRLKDDFDKQVSNIHKHRSRSSSNYDTYQHEPLRARIRFFYPMQGQSSSDVNVDDYLRKISNQEHYIEQLNNEVQQLREQLRRVATNDQVIYDNDQLRNECEALRRTEQHLGTQIAGLNGLLTRFQLHDQPLISTSTRSVVPNDRKPEDTATVLNHTNEELQLDAKNISHISNRITELVQKYDDCQRKLQEKEAEIREYKIREADAERSFAQKYQLRIRELGEDINSLKNQVEESERRVKKLTDENNQLKRIDHSRYANEIEQLNLQIQDLKEQYLSSEKRYEQYRIELDRKHQQRYDDLRIKYEELERTYGPKRIRELESIIESTEEELQRYSVQIEQLKTDLQHEQNHHERDLLDIREQYERQRATEIRSFDELQIKYSELQENSIRQEDHYNRKIQEYEKQVLEYQRRSETAFYALQEKNDTLKKEINTSDVRCQNYEEQIHQARQEKQNLVGKITELEDAMNQLRIDISIEIKEQYENEYRKSYQSINERHEQDIQNILHDRDTAETNYQRCNVEREHFEQQYHTVNQQLQAIQRSVEDYKTDIDNLKIELRKSSERNEYDSRRHADELERRQRRIEELEKLSRVIVQPGSIEARSSDVNYAKYKLKAGNRTDSDQPDHVQLDLQINVNPLENNLQTDENLYQNYSTTNERSHAFTSPDDHEINRIARLQIEHRDREKRSEEILNSQTLTIQEQEQDIQELQRIIHELEAKLDLAKKELKDSEQTIREQHLDLEQYQKANETLNINLKIVIEEREVRLISSIREIKDLKNRLDEMSYIESTRENIDTYELEIKNLKNKLRQNEEIIEDRTLVSRELEEKLRQARQTPGRSEREYLELQDRYEQLGSKIEELERESSNQKEDLRRSQQRYSMLEQKFNESSNVDASAHVRSLETQIRQKDQEIDELKQKVRDARHEISNDGNYDRSSTTNREPKFRSRPDLDHLNREELLFELERALQHNQELNKQLNEKFPSLTELHNQLVQVRQELGRQQYVNQVLWRKLNALIDIHGSSTRLELTHELANYQDELAKLKIQQSRTNAMRSVINNANARSLSEQNLNTVHHDLPSTGNDIPSKNIKSTIALLERSNIEWQTKLARLTEQLGRSESQSRNHQRELNKYQKLFADDSLRIGLNQSKKIHDDLTEITNLDELKEIIRNNRKHLRQLQTRVRINTPDLLQSPTIEKLNEQIQNLNLLIDTYRNESTLLKNELEKHYKTIENNRQTLEQYEKHFKDQQTSIEFLKKHSQTYEQIIQKHDLHLPIFDERKEHMMNSIDDYIIDLDIDIIQGNDKKKSPTSSKRDSTIGGTTYSYEYRQKLSQKDDDIRKLNNKLDEKDRQIRQLDEELAHALQQYHSSPTGHNLNDELLQKYELLKVKTNDYEQENRKLRLEKNQLESENQRYQSLIEHYTTQIDILERKIHANNNDKTEMVIRTSELSVLLEEMRHLRHDLEQSIIKQNELQAKLDENIRQSRSPRSFKFSGHGVSYPDLQVIDASGLVGTEQLLSSSSTIVDDQRSRLVVSSEANVGNVDISHRRAMKQYVVGEVKFHNDLRQIIEGIKFDMKTVAQQLQARLQSRSSSSTNDASLVELLTSFDEHLIRALDLIETYRQANLPENDGRGEYQFSDHRLIEENENLMSQQRKYLQLIQHLKDKHKQDAKYIDQLLVQITSNQH